jgi:hypothetical protein
MKKFSDVVEKDPLKLKKFDSSGGVQVTSRTMYIFLFGIPAFLILSAIFYMLALIFSNQIATS